MPWADELQISDSLVDFTLRSVGLISRRTPAAMRLITRSRYLWTFLILGILAWGVGCKKQPYLKIVQQTPYLGFPAGPDQIYQLDVADLRSREDYARLKEQFDASAPLGAFVRGLRDQTGFDPLEQ